MKLINILTALVVAFKASFAERLYQGISALGTNADAETPPKGNEPPVTKSPDAQVNPQSSDPQHSSSAATSSTGTGGVASSDSPTLVSGGTHEQHPHVKRPQLEELTVVRQKDAFVARKYKNYDTVTVSPTLNTTATTTKNDEL